MKMTSSKFKLKPYKTELFQPSDGMIEKIAGEMAAVWFEAALSSGLKDTKYKKNPRKFAQANLEKFIPFAIKSCMDMLANSNTPHDQKMMIYEQIMKRANDPEARATFPSKTEADKHLSFDLPENFLENNFPQYLDPSYLKKLVN